MMEIKFRAFVKHLRESAEVLSIDFLNSFIEVYLVDRDEIRKYQFGEDEIVLLPFTGLKDKNGREIYAGDIVRGKYGKNGLIKNYEIRWLTGHFAAVDRNNMTGDERYYPVGLLEGEVIGNIFQEGDLLRENSRRNTGRTTFKQVWQANDRMER